MPAMQFPNIIAFVEGAMERAFISNNFHYVSLIPVSNGKSWTTQALCKQIISKFLAKNIFPDHVIVWLDREGNVDGIFEMAAAIRAAFVAARFPADKVHCLIPDKMSENIILADEALIAREFGLSGYAYVFEGMNGSHHLGTLYKQAESHYKKMLHGPILLKKLRLSHATKNQGVKQFLQTFNVACWWCE